MSYDKLLTADPGVWTITLTQGSATASVAGILLVTAGAREGDAVLDDEGRVLVIKALTETEITFAWPYKAATRTIDLVIEQRSINRAINTASSAAAIAALARLQNAANLAPNYPVLSHSNTPPAAPADGDRYLIGIAPTGVWAGKAKHLALYSAATAEWSFTPPEDGMSVVLAGTSARLQYNGTTWGLDAIGAAGGQLTGPLDWAATVDIVSAATVDLGTSGSNLVNITGTTAIVSLGTAANGVWRLVRFAGTLILTHGASLNLPGAIDIATSAGDWGLFVSHGGGTWHCAGYLKADGTPLTLGSKSVTSAKLADAAVSNAKLADAAVSNGKLADMMAGTIKLRALGTGSGAPIDGTPAQARALVQVIDPTPNLLVNGALQHSQEYGNVATTTTAPSPWPYPADQWYTAIIGTGMSVTTQRVAVQTPAGNSHRARLSIAAAKMSLVDQDAIIFEQRIEARALAQAKFGMSTARRLLGSFMFKGPAGTYGYRFVRPGPRGWMGAFTISPEQANTDTLQTISIDADVAVGGDTSSTALGAQFCITLAAGPTLRGAPGYNNSWVIGPSNQLNGAGSTSNVFEIGDLDLYIDISGVGSIRPFVAPDATSELGRCLRYYWKRPSPFSEFSYTIEHGQSWRALMIPFPVEMRASPTCALTAEAQPGASFDATNPRVASATPWSALCRLDASPSWAYTWLTSFTANARL